MAPTADLPDDDRAAAPAAALAPGALLGRFVVRARLGEGGMGVVYAADDPDLQRPAAIKLVSPEVDRPALRARLLREAQAMARLDHPNVVRVFEVGEAGGRLFIAMELVEGETLARWLAAAPRPWREIVAMFRQVGLGLAAIHRAGLVHRDVKPDNVLVDRGGRARVADLGLVRVDPEPAAVASPALAGTLTRTGVAMGTPGYMAPEQQRGSRVDALADQYSFCVALRDALVDARPPAPRALRGVLSRGLAFEPGERFPSMEALLAAIERATTARRRKVVIGGGVTFVVGGVAAAIVIGLGAGGAAPEAAPSPVERAPDVPPAPIVAVTAVDAAPPDAAPTDAAPPAVRRAAAAPPDAGARTPRSPAPLVGGSTTPDAAPARDRILADHLPHVREAIRDLGYRGLDLADVDADVDAQLEATRARRDEVIADAGDDDLRVGIAGALLGMLERRRGDCAAADREWKRAVKNLAGRGPGDPDQRVAHLWQGRIHLGRGLCRLAAGELAGTDERLKDAVMIGWGGGSRAELAELDLAWGIWAAESGDRDASYRHLQNIAYRGDDRVIRALERYAESPGAP